MKYQMLHGIPLKGKKVLMRVDFNVPLNEDEVITDDSRIRQSLPTIRYILDSGGSVILMSHLGRPCGKRVEGLSLAPIAKQLANLLEMPVQMAPDCIGDTVQKMVSRLCPGEVMMLENLRFHPGEEDPDHHMKFVEELAKIGDIYVNDAFGSSHRRHASTALMPQKFDVAAAGFLVEKEVLIISNLLTQAKAPFFALIGGSKVSSKIGILEALLGKVDGLIIGGAMAFTFLKAMGHEVGNSLVDEPHIETARHLMKRCKARGIELHLPQDIIITQSISEDAEVKEVSIEEGIPNGWLGADIGPDTALAWKELFDRANTIFWNGPVGIFELAPFSSGTKSVAEAIASSNAMTIVGGGDSAAALNQMGIGKKITHISTGGGATLEFIERGTLPGLEALTV